MRALTDHEKRTLRFATAGIAIYLVLFAGFKVANYLGARRSEYRRLAAEARGLRQEIQLYEDRIEVIRKLMTEFKMDPAKLSRASVVAQASDAIQKAALAGGLQIGPIREAPGGSSHREVASMQLEGAGPVPAVLAFLSQLGRVGYPLIIDSVQLGADNSRPGQIKLNLTILILDFEQWKLEGSRRA